MTEVIKKLKLGITKQYTIANPSCTGPIQFVRPEVLIWREINEEIFIFCRKMWDF